MHTPLLGAAAVMLATTASPAAAFRASYQPAPPLPAFRCAKLQLLSAENQVELTPDYRLPGSIAGAAGLLTAGTLGLGLPLAVPAAALAGFLASRTRDIRFIFDADSLEIMVSRNGQLLQTGENFAVGGRNRWRYADIVEWAMYPSPENPVLVYFREVATRPSGQGHLFPVVTDPGQLRQVMRERVGEEKRVTSPPQL